jgi:DNA-binding MarR family transcriptional regulator
MKKLDSNETKMNAGLIFELANLSKAITDTSMDDIRSEKLTLPQFHVLAALYLQKKPLTINELIQSAVSSSGNMGVVINNLIKAKLIQKHTDPIDKRKRKIELTDEGLNKISIVYKLHTVTLSKMFSPLCIEKKQELSSLIRELRDGIISQSNELD